MVRYEIELTDGEVEALRAAAAILTDHGACVLRHNPNSRRCLGGNVLVELAKQFQAILDRNRPLAVGDRVRWSGSKSGAAEGTVVYIDSDDYVVSGPLTGGGLIVAGGNWLERVADDAIASERVS